MATLIYYGFFIVLIIVAIVCIVHFYFNPVQVSKPGKGNSSKMKKGRYIMTINYPATYYNVVEFNIETHKQLPQEFFKGLDILLDKHAPKAEEV